MEQRATSCSKDDSNRQIQGSFGRYGIGPLFDYFVISVVFFGRGLVGHFGDRYVGVGPDPSQFMWYLRWWPYALAHHLNPFIPHVIWAPSGVNLAWTASIPLASLIAYPLTATLGVIPSYNLLCLLSPALAGWGAFLLCRHASGSYWPSVLGGFIFAFSPHMIGETFGNLNDALVFPVPLVAYLVLLRLNKCLQVWSFIVLLALLLVVQFLCFIELFATMTLVGGMTILLAIALTGDQTRQRVIALIPSITLSYVMAVIALSPYLCFLLAHSLRQTEIMPTSLFSIDLLNLFIPTALNQLGRLPGLGYLASHFRCGLMESGGYLALPLIAIVPLFARRFGDKAWARLLIYLLALLGVFSLGPKVQVMGHVTPIALPWTLFTKLPFIQKALPARLMLYVFLDLAIMVSIWLGASKARPVLAFSAAALVVIFMLPNLSAAYWITDANVPRFFSSGLYKRYLSEADNIIVMPYSIDGDSMLWQSEANMGFNMVQGWTGFPNPPREFETWPAVSGMMNGADLPNSDLQVRAFLANHNVSGIVIADNCDCEWEFDRGDLQPPSWKRRYISDHDQQLWRRWFARLGVMAIEVGGVSFYKVPREKLTPYKELTALQMQTVDSAQKFEALLVASARYLAEGHDPADITPLRAIRLNLLPSEWTGSHFPYRDPLNQPLLNGMLLASWDSGKTAIGVLSSYNALRPLIVKYGPSATLIRYFTTDIPPKFTERSSREGQLLLVMTFTRAALAEQAARIETEQKMQPTRAVQVKLSRGSHLEW